MSRDPAALESQPFDLLIVGAGVYGAALAREAGMQGWSVAVVDRGDFASGSSSNSLKILHGGLRYLQQLDLPRMRSSIRARRGWAQLAPEFVTPLACAIATRGHGTRSTAALGAALLANELVSFDRNHGLRETNRLPPARLLSSNEYAAITDGLCSTGKARGALWWDALALDTERLVLELLADAADHRAVLANYVDVKRLLFDGGSVRGAVAVDNDSGRELQIRARRVVCTGSAVSAEFMRELPGLRHVAARPRCHALNLVVRHTLPTPTALALPATGGVKGLKGDLFFVPWKGFTMVGTHYALNHGQPLTPEYRRRLVGELFTLIGNAAPHWPISESSISFIHWGDLPMDKRWRPGEPIKLSGSLEVTNAGAGAAGLWMVSGPKFTTALEAAEIALPRIVKGLDATTRRGPQSHISEFTAGLTRMDESKDAASKAQAAACSLQAMRLDDVLLRRTGLGSSGHPGRNVLLACARGMGRALNWSDSKIAAEISAAEMEYRDKHFWEPPAAADTSNIATMNLARAFAP